MQLNNVDINSIKPSPDNPRIIEHGIDKVAASIRKFGFRNPILVDKDGYIIAGHVRYEAAKKLGMKTVPVILVEDLTENQIALFRIVDNKTAEQSGWNFEELENELAQIHGIDMTEFGFDEMKNELDKINDFFDDVSTGDTEEATDGKSVKEICCPCCGGWFKP